MGDKPNPHPNNPNDKFDCFVLQGKYYGEWDDLTAEQSLEAILKQRETYEVNDPGIPLRIQAETKSGKRRIVRISKSHLQPRRPYEITTNQHR